MATIISSNVFTEVNLSYMPGYVDVVNDKMSISTSNVDNYNNNINNLPNNNNSNYDNDMNNLPNNNSNYDNDMNNLPNNNSNYNNDMNNLPNYNNTNYNNNIDNAMPYIPSFPSNNNNNYNYDTNEEGIRDRDYLLNLYPIKAREAKKIAQDEMNKLDYPDSIIYHEYPDKAALLSIIDRIMNLEKNVEINRELLEVLFYNEMINKRRSYYNQKNNK